MTIRSVLFTLHEALQRYGVKNHAVKLLEIRQDVNRLFHLSRFYRWRPQRLAHYILVTFVIVTLPVMVLAISAGEMLVSQANSTREHAQHAREATSRGHQMQQLASAITRAAMQYEVLENEDLGADVIERLLGLTANYRNQLQVQSFVINRPILLDALHKTVTAIEQRPMGELGQTLIRKTSELNDLLDKTLTHERDQLQAQAEQLQFQVVLLSIVLVGISITLIVFFTRRINYHFSHISSRILALGHSERESKPVHSGGPGEFAEIDQRIDWLSNRLTDLENEKMRFLRHVSHELKTPLSVLVEGSDLLDEGVTGSLTEPQREVVGMLQENAVKLQLLIDQLLDYNKLSATNTLNIEVVDITQTVHNIINRHKMLIAQRSIRTLLPNHPQLWKTDADLLQRVLANLISNAVHYGQQEGVLTITIIDEGLQLHVDVKNSGVPIQAEDIPHLFEPFYQGKQERDGAVQGTGIGLSIAQDAAKALGGVLSLKDNKDNQVCFRLTLEQQNESKDLG